LALAIARSSDATRVTLVTFFRALAEAMMTLVRGVIWFAPIGVLALVLPLAAHAGAALVGAIGFYIVAYSAFVLPLATAMFHIAGPVSWTIGALFVGWFYNVPLHAAQLATVAFAAVFPGFAAPGVPRGAFIMLTPLLLAVGLPAEGVGLLIAADATPDTFSTVMNVTGDLAATALARIAPEHPRLLELTKPNPPVAGSEPSHTSLLVHGTFAKVNTWWQPSGDFHSYVLAPVRADLDQDVVEVVVLAASYRADQPPRRNRTAPYRRPASRHEPAPSWKAYPATD